MTQVLLLIRSVVNNEILARIPFKSQAAFEPRAIGSARTKRATPVGTLAPRQKRESGWLRQLRKLIEVYEYSETVALTFRKTLRCSLTRSTAQNTPVPGNSMNQHYCRSAIFAANDGEGHEIIGTT